MSNKLKLSVLLLTAFAIGFGFNNFAMSDIGEYKVAVVNIPVVLSKSAQFKALQAEQEQKLKEVQDWLKVVKADVDKQATDAGKQKLLKKYDAEFAKRQEAVKKEYATKLKAIDKNVSELIAKEAKAQNYNLVLRRNSVLYGGTDITKSIADAVK